MKKILNCICLSLFMVLMGSCGGVDGKIDSYESALKDKNVEKAANILSKLSEEPLTNEQKERILEIHDEYFTEAIDAVIDKFEKYMEEGKVEKAAKEIEGLQDDQLTASQAARITEITMKYASEEMSKYGKMADDMKEMFSF